jgi:hypothetical protein
MPAVRQRCGSRGQQRCGSRFQAHNVSESEAESETVPQTDSDAAPEANRNGAVEASPVARLPWLPRPISNAASERDRSSDAASKTNSGAASGRGQNRCGSRGQRKCGCGDKPSSAASGSATGHSSCIFFGLERFRRFPNFFSFFCRGLVPLLSRRGARGRHKWAPRTAARWVLGYGGVPGGLPPQRPRGATRAHFLCELVSDAFTSFQSHGRRICDPASLKPSSYSFYTSLFLFWYFRLAGEVLKV